jgi:hypothetical protein
MGRKPLRTLQPLVDALGDAILEQHDPGVHETPIQQL